MRPAWQPVPDGSQRPTHAVCAPRSDSGVPEALRTQQQQHERHSRNPSALCLGELARKSRAGLCPRY